MTPFHWIALGIHALGLLLFAWAYGVTGGWIFGVMAGWSVWFGACSTQALRQAGEFRRMGAAWARLRGGG